MRFTIRFLSIDTGLLVLMQMRMNVKIERTIAALTPNVSTPSAHLSALVFKDILEMVFSVPVRRSNSTKVWGGGSRHRKLRLL